MNALPKKFKCLQCGKETYKDYEKCESCCKTGTIFPIIKDHYICYLNGKFYGSGSKEYMLELFKDYVVTCGMYEKHECEFRIVKVLDGKFKDQLLKNS